MNRLRLAVAGPGAIGGFHARAVARPGAHRERVELAAVAARETSGALALAQEVGCAALSFEDLLAERSIDAVVLATPTGSHAELGARILASGKHLLVEKPIDVSVEAADRLLDAARAEGRTLSVVSQHRFDAASRTAHEVLAAGDLGTVTSVSIEVPLWRGPEYFRSRTWRGTRKGDGGGALLNQGIHLVDLALWLAGPVARVQAAAATRTHPIEVEDVVSATLEFASGAIGSLLATTSACPGGAPRLAVRGDRGSLVIENDELVYLHVADGPVPEYGAYGALNQAAERLPPAGATERDTNFMPYAPSRAQLLDFCAAVLDGATPAVSGEDGRNALELVHAVYQAAEEVRPVTTSPTSPAERHPFADRKALASVFDRCAPTYERVGVAHFAPMGRLLVDRAALRLGESVLDVGCGTGTSLVPAAEAVGPEGRVVGVDLSPGMIARAEAATHGLPQVSTVLGDGEDPGKALGSSHQTFDAVLAGMVLFLMPDPRAALRRYHALLAEDGRLALSWWGPGDERWGPVFAAGAPYGRAASAHNLPASSPFRSVQALESALRDSGFAAVESTEQVITTRFAEPAQWWSWLWSTAGRVFWESVPEEDRPAATAAVTRELQRLRADDGSLTMSATVRITVATGGAHR